MKLRGAAPSSVAPFSGEALMFTTAAICVEADSGAAGGVRCRRDGGWGSRKQPRQDMKLDPDGAFLARGMETRME